MSSRIIPLQNAVKPMVLTAVQYCAEKGNPDSVIQTIYDFAFNYRRIMIVGDSKGAMIDKVLLEHKPKIMYELGCFVGYSAVRFGNLIKQWGGKFYSFEIDEQSVEVSRKIIEHAGLQDTVEVIHGSFDSAIGPFLKEHSDHVGKVDALFIDHWKDQYVPDIKIIESLNIMHPGTAILADNVISPGAPDYIEYIQSKSDQYTHEFLHNDPEKDGGHKDAVLYSLV
ncbi:hypothetical protein INT43_002077, partial [Umbelopsis isabellina]